MCLNNAHILNGNPRERKSMTDLKGLTAITTSARTELWPKFKIKTEPWMIMH